MILRFIGALIASGLIACGGTTPAYAQNASGVTVSTSAAAAAAMRTKAKDNKGKPAATKTIKTQQQKR